MKEMSEEMSEEDGALMSEFTWLSHPLSRRRRLENSPFVMFTASPSKAMSDIKSNDDNVLPFLKLRPTTFVRCHIIACLALVAPKQIVFRNCAILSFATTIAIMDRFTSFERLSLAHSSVPQAGAGDVQSLSLTSTDEQAALADTPLKARVSSYDGDHKSYMKDQATCRSIGPIFWKEIHTGLQAPHNTLAERTFPPSVFTSSNV